MQKGPYFQNVQFVDPLPQGYMQTAANIGNAYGNMFRQIGQDLGEGIKQYAQNKEQRDGNQQVFQTEIAPAIARIQNAVNLAQKNPDDPSARLAGYANDDRVKALIPQLSKFDSMSTSQQNKFIETARNTMTSIERDELRNYTRDLEQQKLNLEKANFFNNAAIAIQSGKNDEARIALEKQRTELAARQATLEEKKTNAEVGKLNAETDNLKKPKVVPPESPLGKLVADRDAAILSGDVNTAAAIQIQINAEVAKANQEVQGGKALNQDQSNAVQFAARMNQNERFIAKSTYDPTVFWNGSWTPERFQGDDLKSYDAAKMNWIAAALRKESGAAISKDEYTQFDKQYFPQPGDGKDVIKQKQEMRAQAYKGMVAAIGPDGEKHVASALYQPAAQTPRFQSEAEALASGKKGEVEIFDSATRKWRKAQIN